MYGTVTIKIEIFSIFVSKKEIRLDNFMKGLSLVGGVYSNYYYKQTEKDEKFIYVAIDYFIIEHHID